MPILKYNPITKEYDVVYDKPEETKTGQPIIPIEDQMRIRKIYGGFPIYNTSTGLNQITGSLVIIQTNSVSSRLRVRLNNINTSISLT